MSAIDTSFHVLSARLRLHRHPRAAREMHRGWDAADELLAWYVLGSVDEMPKAGHRWPEPFALKSEARVLIVDDGFGALPLALRRLSPWVTHDSWISRESLLQNAELNGIELDETRLLSSQEALPGLFDLVIVKAPERADVMQAIDRRLQPHLAPGAKILTAAMLKNNRHSELGSTTHSSIYKKACVHVTLVDAAHELPPSPFPYDGEMTDPKFSYRLEAGVFAGREDEDGRAVDIGTRLLLDHLPAADASVKRIGDLGCGSGLLGTAAALRFQAAGHPLERLDFFDDSARALACAKRNAAAALPELEIHTHWTDCLTGFTPSLDLILCNPPFHAGNVRGDAIAWRMFTHSHRVLSPGGTLRLVGNRHLQYHAKLSKIFGGHKVITSTKQFVVLDAER